MTINLDADVAEQVQCLDVTRWTLLQAEVCMNVANAKFYAFEAEAARLGEMVRYGAMPRATATEYLHTSALYNGLYCEYGRDQIQAIMASAFQEARHD